MGKPRRTTAVRVLAGASPTEREVAARTLPPASGIDPDLWLLHVCLHRRGDPELRRVLVEHYQGYAVGLARRMHRQGEPLEDLCQVAFEALVVSLERFDPERRRPFLGFASVTIRGALKRHYRDFGWLLRVPRRVHDLVPPIRRATEELQGSLGRTPTVAEVAARVGVAPETVIEVRQAAHARSARSLSPVGDGEELTVSAPVDAGYERSVERIDLARALAELGREDRELLCRYFFEGRTQDELAAQAGVSQMQISRLLGAATRRLADRTAVVC